jgi:hypothetical protein
MFGVAAIERFYEQRVVEGGWTALSVLSIALCVFKGALDGGFVAEAM